MTISLITTIAINLAILLLASWVVGLVVLIRLAKDKEELEIGLKTARKKLKKAKSTTPPPKTKPAETSLPEFPLEPVVAEESDESLYLLDTVNNIGNNLLEKEQQLDVLAKLHAKQRLLLDEWQETSPSDQGGEAITNHEETNVIIEKLQHDLTINQRVIQQLESKLREGQDKDSRIAILEETEKRLRDRVDQLKKNKQQAVILAEGLRKANDKKQSLIHDNEKLKRNIKELSNASQEQLATINKISSELDRATQLERYQRQVIDDLESKLHSEKSGANDTKVVNALEEQLKNTAETLARTLKEKEFIESHLLEMDKALGQTKETEEALERARKEIETLEMYFPDFEPEIGSDSATAETETHEPLPQLTITKEDDPVLFNIIGDNRLFGILQEFWMTLDTPPIQLIGENNIARPKALNYWVKTSIHNDEFFITIGSNEKLIEILSKAMFNKTIASLSDSDMEDALGELGNVIAGTLANELNTDYVVGISQHIDNNNIETELKNTAIASEILMSANDQPLYIALAKPDKPS